MGSHPMSSSSLLMACKEYTQDQWLVGGAMMGGAYHRLFPGCLQVSSELLQLGQDLLHLLNGTRHLLLFIVVHLVLVVVQKAFKLDPSVGSELIVSSCLLHPSLPPYFSHHPNLPFLQFALCSLSPRIHSLLTDIKDGFHSSWPVKCLAVQFNVLFCYKNIIGVNAFDCNVTASSQCTICDCLIPMHYM